MTDERPLEGRRLKRIYLLIGSSGATHASVFAERALLFKGKKTTLWFDSGRNNAFIDVSGVKQLQTVYYS